MSQHPAQATPLGTAPGQDAPLHLAGFWRRVQGWLIDWLLIGTMLQLPLWFLMPARAPWASADQAAATSWWQMLTPDPVGLVLTVVNGLLLALLNRDGQTPGRRWARTRLVHLDGTPLSGTASLPRYLFHLADDIVLGLGWLLPLLDLRNQTIADKLAHSLVVDLREATPSTSARPRLTQHYTDPFEDRRG